MTEKECPTCGKLFKFGAFVKMTFVREMVNWPEICNSCATSLRRYIDYEHKHAAKRGMS